MGSLPIPADMIFDDFSSDILEYNTLDNDTILGTYRGLPNADEDGNYIGFLANEQPKISEGNTICTVDGMETFQIRKISYDRYEGKPEFLKAYH